MSPFLIKSEASQIPWQKNHLKVPVNGLIERII
ncbi:MAG: hypothetical protein ACI828_002501, partial [Flavobacteriales bacterium]